MLHFKSLPTFFFATTALVAACALGDYGEGRFTVSNVTGQEACLNRAFPLEANFFAARQRVDSLGIFMQTRGGTGASYDLVYVEVHQPETIRERLGQPLPLSEPTDLDPVVVARVLLLDSCPDVLESFYVAGTITFDALSPEDDRRVEGTITSARLVTARTQEEVASFEGNWSFDVLRGPPHEEFYPPYRP